MYHMTVLYVSLGQNLEHSVPFFLLYCTNIILSAVVNNYFERINHDDDESRRLQNFTILYFSGEDDGLT